LSLAGPARPSQVARARLRRLTSGPHLPATARVRARTLSLPLSLSLPGGPDLSVPNHPRSWPLSLAAQWDLDISVDCPVCRSPSLVYEPRLSATPLFPNLPLAVSVVDAPTTAHFPAMTSAPKPFYAAHAHSLPSLSCALSRAPSPSLSLYARSRGTSPKDRRRFVAIAVRPSRPLPR
jgi:hypothetical protein